MLVAPDLKQELPVLYLRARRATMTQFSNEPTYVDGGDKPDGELLHSIRVDPRDARSLTIGVSMVVDRRKARENVTHASETSRG